MTSNYWYVQTYEHLIINPNFLLKQYELVLYKLFSDDKIPYPF